MDKVWIRLFVRESLSCSLQGHTQGMGQHTIFSAGRHINHSAQSNLPAVRCKGSNLPAAQSMLIAASSLPIAIHAVLTPKGRKDWSMNSNRHCLQEFGCMDINLFDTILERLHHIFIPFIELVL